jgi:hypothetical protein
MKILSFLAGFLFLSVVAFAAPSSSSTAKHPPVHHYRGHRNYQHKHYPRHNNARHYHGRPVHHAPHARPHRAV